MSALRITRLPTFYRLYLLPNLLVLVLPVFGLFFFTHAEEVIDRQIEARLEADLSKATKLTEGQRLVAITFYRANPISKILASSDPQMARHQQVFASMETAARTYAIFRWMKRLSWVCLGGIGLTLVIVGTSVALSLRSQAAQYWALRIGAPVLKTSATIQVLGQSVLAVALSYWFTAIESNRYYPQIIIIMAVLALMVVAAALRAVFVKPPVARYRINGERIPEAAAPSLWHRVREMAARLETKPPDQIVVGTASQFFVAEMPMTLGEEALEGRTLYLSLPMLKIMAADEAEAVLGHELAHFSGNDTLWGRKITPLIDRFDHYLRALMGHRWNVVGRFMYFFWGLYGLSIRRQSRAREFRADAIGAELTSAEACKRALLKVTSYGEYRREVETEVVQASKVDQSLNLAERLEQGYPIFLASYVNGEKELEERVAHPFDTHPTLRHRLEHLGINPETAVRDPLLGQPVAGSWYHAILPAPALEERMWAGRQKALQDAQAEDLVFRVPQTNDELTTIMEQYPTLVLQNAEGAEVTLEYDRFVIPGWGAPILFEDIGLVMRDATREGMCLTITHLPTGAKRAVETKVLAATFRCEKGDLVTLFYAYYNRHRKAKVRG
jgi:Zn-dependent protease with chaperone function